MMLRREIRLFRLCYSVSNVSETVMFYFLRVVLKTLIHSRLIAERYVLTAFNILSTRKCANFYGSMAIFLISLPRIVSSGSVSLRYRRSKSYRANSEGSFISSSSDIFLAWWCLVFLTGLCTLFTLSCDMVY